MTRPRVALCLFGLPRSFDVTAPSIAENLIAPLSEQADLVTLGHFFADSADQDEQIPAQPGAMLPFDDLVTEAPLDCLDRWQFRDLVCHGDYWRNGFVSLRNLVHQLHSLRRVTTMAMAAGATQCLFIRPDLQYHDSIGPVLPRMLAATPPRVWLPQWQHWKGGLNDRFAFCSGQAAIRAYGARISMMQNFCNATGEPVQSERLLAFALWSTSTPWSPLPLRATRIRASAVAVQEDFDAHHFRVLRQRTRRQIKWLYRGLRPGAPLGTIPVDA